MGSAISRSLSQGNYRVLLYTDIQHEARDLISGIKKMQPSADIEEINCKVQAAWEADIVILAVPFQSEMEVAEKIREMVNQKVVISLSDPLNSSHNGLITPPDTSTAEELQKLLPNSKVIKTFNTALAADFLTPVIDGTQADAFIAGDDDEALQTVTEVVATAGFNPIIAGHLSVSRILENMQLLLIQLGMKYNYSWPAGWKILHH